MSHSHRLRAQEVETVADMWWGAERCLDGIALEGRLGQAYNEKAFRYLLTIERRRFERSGCPFLFLMVDLKEQDGTSARVDSMVASNIFSNLRRCLRETDFVGWYREDHVAGAVLTELRNGLPMEVSSLIGKRVSEMLCERLPSDVSRRLRVRIYHQPELERIDADGGFHAVHYTDVTHRSFFHSCALAIKRAIALAVGAVALLLAPLS